MINLKTQLEESTMKKVQEIISKAIENKMELKIDDDLETNLENLTIFYDDFTDYVDLISDLLSYSQMTLSGKTSNYFSSFEKCDFTKNNFFDYLTLEAQIWKVLDENVLDKELVSDFHFFRLENDFDDIMTENRKKVFELKFDQTEVWKELEPRIEKGIGNKGYLEKVKNWNKPQEKKSRKSAKNWIIFLMVIGIIAFLVSGQGPEEFPEFLIKSIVVVVIAVTIIGVGKYIIEFYSMRH